jgi:hypothetical protein
MVSMRIESIDETLLVLLAWTRPNVRSDFSSLPPAMLIPHGYNVMLILRTKHAAGSAHLT